MRIADLWRLGVVALAVLVVALVGGLLAPKASAAVPLGGGTGIVVDGSYCTLTTIGHDNTGELVGFTAAHCGGPGAQVVAEGTDDTVRSVVVTNGDLDYAVIKCDPAKVTPIPDFADFVINGIGPNPEWHQPACRLGAATGYFCSGITSLSAPGPNPRMSMSGGLYQPGDDGGPVTSDGVLIGMIVGGVLTPGDLLGAPRRQFTDLKRPVPLVAIQRQSSPRISISALSDILDG